MRRLAWLAAWCVLLAWPPARATAADTPQVRVEAARGSAQAFQPPEQGWETVRLPDNWAPRWPDHDGVVWYRLRWDEPAGPAPASRGLRLDYVSLAAAFFVNGHEIGRDRSLVEPLSRSWNLPRYWQLDAPLLRPGGNEILIRVSGLAGYQPGLGEVRIGPPGALRADFERREFWARSVHWVGLGLTAAMAVVFGMLWLLRRSETPYGWFALFCAAWGGYVQNNVAYSPWPFATTPGYQHLNHVLLVASLAAFALFVLDLAGRGGRWGRRAVAATALVAWVLTLAPLGDGRADARNVVVLLSLGLYIAGVLVILRHAWATRRIDTVVLAASLLCPLVAGAHDTLVFVGAIPGDTYYAPLSAMGTLLGSSFALTWRMVEGMRLIENFNAELQARVARARAQLAESMAGQHAAELEQTRLAERMNMVRDLHDGLGMTLSSHLHALREGGDPAPGARSALSALQEVSDDLRLIIETSSFEGSDALLERLAPLRHRATRLLEAAGIEADWHLAGLEDCRLEGRHALDFLRVLQEALANVLKHSGATRVRIDVRADPDELLLRVADDGRGLPSEATASTGFGIRNMRARAQRLHGKLALDPQVGGTVLELRCPLALGAAAPAEAGLERSPA